MEDNVRGILIVFMLASIKVPETAANRIPKEATLFSCNETKDFFEEIKQVVGGFTSCASLQKHQLLLEESLVQEKEKLKMLGAVVQENTENTAHLLSDNAKTLEALQHLEMVLRLLVAKSDKTSGQCSDHADRGHSPVQIVLSVPSVHSTHGSNSGGGNSGSSGSGADAGAGAGGIEKEVKEELAKLKAEMDSHRQNVTNIVSDVNRKLKDLESQTTFMKDTISELMGALHGINEYVRIQYKAKQDCPASYGRIGSKCLYLENYRKKSFFEARKHCQEKAAQLNGDGDLAVVQDVYEFITYVARSEKAKSVTWLWVGAYRQDRNSHWKWVTEDVVSKEHFVWDEQEPSNSEDENAVCFQMSALLFHNCQNNLKINYVCEFVNTGNG